MQNYMDPTVSPLAIVDHRQSRWTAAVRELSQLEHQECSTAFKMGDRLNEAAVEFGESKMKALATEAGLDSGLVTQRRWVSTKIPPGHPSRALRLTYKHYRALAGIEDDTVRDTWIEEIQEKALSANALVKQLSEQRVEQVQRNHQECIQCEQPVPELERMVSFSIGKGAHGYCCTVQCAARYFIEQTEESTEATGGPITAIPADLFD